MGPLLGFPSHDFSLFRLESRPASVRVELAVIHSEFSTLPTESARLDGVGKDGRIVQLASGPNKPIGRIKHSS